MRFRTFSGKHVDLLNIQAKDIDVTDIAVSLSRQCRFRGHTQYFYSNAQHSLLVMESLQSDCPVQKLACLLHDACEAYLGDEISLIKERAYYMRERTGVQSHETRRSVEHVATREILKALVPKDARLEAGVYLQSTNFKEHHDFVNDVEVVNILRGHGKVFGATSVNLVPIPTEQPMGDVGLQFLAAYEECLECIRQLNGE